MASTHRARAVAALTRRASYLDERLLDQPDGGRMFERRERAALRYALALIDAARRLDVVDRLEADALERRDIPSSQASAEARQAVRR